MSSFDTEQLMSRLALAIVLQAVYQRGLCQGFDYAMQSNKCPSCDDVAWWPTFFDWSSIPDTLGKTSPDDPSVTHP